MLLTRSRGLVGFRMGIVSIIARALRFVAVASAVELRVWESETDGNPSVDADESTKSAN